MKNDDKDLSMPFKVASAGLAGCTADIATFPFDTIKVWLQVRGENSATVSPSLSAKGLKPSTLSSAGASIVKSSKLPSPALYHSYPFASANSRAAAVYNFNEMTLSELYVSKKSNITKPAPSATVIRDAVKAIKLKANATQTFSELTMSEIYMASRKAAITAARSSKKATDGALQTIAKNIKANGFRSLYSGLNAGLQRQMGFCSVRIGLYDQIKQFYVNLFPGSSDSKMVGQRILAGATAGCIAVCLFQPTEVVKIRMQAEKGRYSGSFQAYRSVFKAGGLRELWKGADANCARLALVNVCELVTYDVVKEAILKRNLMTDNMPCHFTSALVAGLVTTVIANPVDVIKTRYMNSEKATYKNPIQCAAMLTKNEGVTAFYKGFFPSYVRIGLWNLAMFVSYEQYKKLFRSLSEKDN